MVHRKAEQEGEVSVDVRWLLWWRGGEGSGVGGGL